MDLTRRKNKLISAFKKIEDVSLLERVETLVFASIPSASSNNLSNFLGIWDKESAEHINRVIEEDCRKIDTNEW